MVETVVRSRDVKVLWDLRPVKWTLQRYQARNLANWLAERALLELYAAEARAAAP